MEEPKISHIEKLIKHFKESGREDELEEILREHGIKDAHEMAINPETHELNPEALVLDKIENKGFWKKIKHIWGVTKYLFTEKWYVRYGIYYVILFSIIFAALNAPIIFNNFQKLDTTVSPQIITYQTIEQQKMEQSAPLDPGEVVPSTPQVIIPKIGVTAPIIFLNTTDEKTIQDNLTRGVVHYSGTANPGEVGNTFITGHSSNFWWIKGNYNYIFLNLNKLAVGDQAKIYYNGNKFVYSVKEVLVVEPSNTSVLAPSDTPTLTLMTCTPAGTNWKRLIVKFDQISPVYYKPQIVTKQALLTPDNLPSTDSNSVGGILGKLWSWAKSLFVD